MHKDFQPETPPAPDIGFTDFLKVDIRVGRIVRVAEFPEARKPSYRLWIDFGPVIGERKSAAQITVNYTPDALLDRRIMAVVNFPPRQIGPMRSEVLVLGFADETGAIRLAQPDGDVPLGARLA